MVVTALTRWVQRYAEKHNLGVMMFVRASGEDVPMAVIVAGKTDGEFARLFSHSVLSQEDMRAYLHDAAAELAFGAAPHVEVSPLYGDETEH